MNRSRRWLVTISFFVSLAAVTLVMGELCLPQVAANGQRYFVVCKHEDLDKDREYTGMGSDPMRNGWTFDVLGPQGALLWQQTTSGDGCTVFPNIQESGTYTVCEHLQDGWINSYRYAAPPLGTPPGGELCTSDLCCMSHYVSLEYVGPIEILFGNYRQPVGGETEPASMFVLLAPWLGLGAVIVLVGIAASARRRRAGSA